LATLAQSPFVSLGIKETRLMRTHNEVTERRRQERGTMPTEPTRQHVISNIIGTFREMPGLCLHVNQAARLFGLRPSACEVILRDLVAQGTLRLAHDGQYLGARLDGLRQMGQPAGLASPAASGPRATSGGRSHQG
jgi:hypothetical protein